MEDIEWNVVNESQLLDAMVGHKPVGVNKYFQMAFIIDKFAEHLQKEVSSDKVWEHLQTMYNLEALDDGESLPFPNSEKDFNLPDSDFSALLIKKEEDRKAMQKGRETPKNAKEVIKKEEKTPVRNVKEVQRRDSKDSKDKMPSSSKKEVAKKEPEKGKGKTKSNVVTPKEESKGGKVKNEDTPKPTKRPTRGSLKPDDSSSSGKSSPVTTPTPGAKRRRI